VLPLATPPAALTHGLYCDEFAEFQTKDIPVRQRLGGFLPANGVGTGFSRTALERLPGAAEGHIFDPACLTEDYETGYQLFALGCRQVFVPVRFDAAGPIATREYFPRTLRAAVRQRSRWVTGISLQGWERHGWRAPWRQVYWFWRDRKGLAGNLLLPVTNLIFLYGAWTRIDSAVRHVPWHFGSHIPAWPSMMTAVIALCQAGMRTYASRRIYGGRFAAGAPLRMLWGNVVNSIATALAVREFIGARVRRHALAWRKTEHAYPAHRARELGRPRLGEILVHMRCVSIGDMEEALLTLPKERRIGEHLLHLQRVSEEDLYHALSLQAGLPCGMPPRADVDRLATRTLPAETARRCKVMPYRVEVGQLHVLSTDVPSDETISELSSLSALEIRFRLVRPRDFERMAAEYLPRTA
jgi:adsorption protein B